jgi:AcrR family transcriptional regulator
MSWSKKSRHRRGYHHGNLREALIEAALALIAEKGPAGFSFAEAARSAGVTPAAPYRHFRDRDALMADVARRGFESLRARLEEAWNEGRPDPLKAFEAMGRAYLVFAREEAASYVAMFESQLPHEEHPDLARAGDAAFAVLRQAAEAVVATLPEGRRAPALMVALHMWATAHGIASLFARGDAGRRPLPMTPEALLEAALLVYFEGLKGGDG